MRCICYCYTATDSGRSSIGDKTIRSSSANLSAIVLFSSQLASAYRQNRRAKRAKHLRIGWNNRANVIRTAANHDDGLPTNRSASNARSNSNAQLSGDPLLLGERTPPLYQSSVSISARGHARRDTILPAALQRSEDQWFCQENQKTVASLLLPS